MSQPLPRFRARQDETERLRRIARICLNTDDEPTPTTRRGITARTAPGDARRLRYIPVIAEGIPGTIPGTNPLATLLHNND